MLHRKIGRGKYHACPIFDLPRQPVRRDCNRHARLIAGDPTAAKPLGYSGSSAAVEKKIGHNSIFGRATRNDSLKQLLRLLSGIAYPLGIFLLKMIDSQPRVRGHCWLVIVVSVNFPC